MTMASVRVIGTGSYVPPKVLKNSHFREMGLDTDDEWIVKRTGIKERRIADQGIYTSDLGYEASKKALSMADVKPENLDLIIMATITPDTCCPSGANWLEAKLGADNAISFDITAACSGFVFALSIAEAYLKTGNCNYVLVVAAEVMSRTLDWTDRTSCVFWGDGAGAAVLTTGDDGPVLLSTHIHTDGKGGKNLLLPGGGSRTTPISHESVERKLHTLKLEEAHKSFKVAVIRFVDAIKEAAEHNNIDVQDIDWFIPHQANLRIFQAISRKLNIPMERFYVTIHKYGNVSSASCAIALDEAARDGSIKEGHLVCVPVFGGGLTWGSALIKY